VRTGVTVILPHGGDVFWEKVRAAVHTINGYGKVCGFEQVRELGLIEAPIALTNTLNVGLVADALIQHAIRRHPAIGVDTGGVNVVVGETNDGHLNDIQGRHVRAEHVWAAIESASTGPVLEGAVGAGTGTSCFGWKGGIGSASRVLPAEGGGFTLGALVQTNFGRPEHLTVLGAPVGRYVSPPEDADTTCTDGGSVMIVLATDAPMTARQLQRLCRRAAVGLARTGSVFDHGSGDFVIAFSTANRVAHEPDALIETRPVLIDEAEVMRHAFPAVVEAVEEAVLNALWRAETVVGRDGQTRQALPLDDVARVFEARGLR
jgi:D-aminopeptidase